VLGAKPKILTVSVGEQIMNSAAPVASCGFNFAASCGFNFAAGFLVREFCKPSVQLITQTQQTQAQVLPYALDSQNQRSTAEQAADSRQQTVTPTGEQEGTASGEYVHASPDTAAVSVSGCAQGGNSPQRKRGVVQPRPALYAMRDTAARKMRHDTRSTGGK